MLSQNLIHGDALTMLTSVDDPIVFAEWGYLGKGEIPAPRLPIRHPTSRAAFSEEGTLFAELGEHESSAPTRTYPPLTVEELAG